MSYFTNIGTISVDLIQASSYAAGGSSPEFSADVKVTAADMYNSGDIELTGDVTMNMDGVEFYDNIPESITEDIQIALEQYMDVCLNPKDYKMGKFGILNETGGKIVPSHRYFLVVYAYGKPENPEFRFVPVRSITRAECKAECEEENRCRP